MRLYLSRPGVVCGAGNGAEQFWSSLTNGNNSGIVRVRTFSGDEFFAGKIDDSILQETDARFDMRIIRIEELALKQISSEIDNAIAKYGRDRIAVCVGSCDNGSEFSVAGHRKYFSDGAFEKNYSIEMQGADYPATYIKEKYGLTGPAYVFATACSSSGSAIIKAAEIIRTGLADAAIVGGADVASDTVLLGFSSLESISPEKTNPFSKNREGITLGEGAAFFILSRDSGGVELLGYGESSDANHITAPLADGSGAAAAMEAAMQDADIKTVDYINLHGTGTHLNDAMEARGIKLAFSNSYDKIPCSSTKPITGHTLGASSAIELAACWFSIETGKLPVHVYDGLYDDELPRLNLVTEDTEFSNKKISVCMSNSFGFGGCNVSLIIGKTND